MMNSFQTLNAKNVNEHTEQKGNLTYLSWAWAWAEIKQLYPNATYEVKKFDGGFPYLYDEKTGYMVFTSVTIEDLTYEMWLPVMDYRNKAIMSPTVMDINKTIMRCLVKNLAMFGLGLYIYAGEDLPDGEESPGSLPFLDAGERSEYVTEADIKILNQFLSVYPQQNRRAALSAAYAKYSIEDFNELTKTQYAELREEFRKNAEVLVEKRLKNMVADFAKKAGVTADDARVSIETIIGKELSTVNIADFVICKKQIQEAYKALGNSNE